MEGGMEVGEEGREEENKRATALCPSPAPHTFSSMRTGKAAGPTQMGIFQDIPRALASSSQRG